MDRKKENTNLYITVLCFTLDKYYKCVLKISVKENYYLIFKYNLILP